MSLNHWTQQFKNNPLQFLKNHPISPPDNSEIVQTTAPRLDSLGQPVLSQQDGTPLMVGKIDLGYTKSPITTDGMFARFFPGATQEIESGTFSEGKVNRLLGQIRLEQDPTRPGALTFNVKIAQSPDRISCYFLPWNDKTLVEMIIPQTKAASSSPNNPDIFFTAGINGCSIFVSGSSLRPRIIHAGLSGGQTPYGNEAAKFWQDLVTCARVAKGNYGNVQTYEINNTDYVNQSGVSGGSGTRNSKAYETWLRHMPSGDFSVESVVPWGAVFGLRTGRHWAFYLQENATIHRYRFNRTVQKKTFKTNVVKKSFMGLRSKTKEVEQELDQTVVVREDSQVCQVMVVRPFYPSALANQQFLPKFRKI